MTEGEKAIYAAELVRSYAEVREHARDEEHERELMHSAAESACGVVSALRDIVPELKDGFGGGSDVYKMALAMTSRRR